MLIVYDKLVRDRIPEIIEADGKTCTVRTLSPEELLPRLRAKLDEEVREYRESGTMEELADIVEVVQALVEHSGSSWAEFEEMRARKREERGGLRCGYLLESVTERDER